MTKTKYNIKNKKKDRTQTSGFFIFYSSFQEDYMWGGSYV